MSGDPVMVLRAGPSAMRHIERHGVSVADVACIPAAAGGPKGLALIPFDQLLYREWLQHSTAPIELVGASVGAWRMAALARPDASKALADVRDTYVRDQDYRVRPTPDDVAAACRRIACAARGPSPLELRPGVTLSVVTSRARGPLHGRSSRAAFGRAVLSNALSRDRLAGYLERVVFSAGTPGIFAAPYDAFGLRLVPLDPANAEDALLASGTIPLLCSPVRDVAGAPPGDYWDGALVDYHLLLPYERVTRREPRPRLVLYPHFNDYVTPGWLDKHLPWRRAPRGHPWLDDVLLVAPSPAFLARLPNGKLPDRQDFYRYGQDHAARIRAWERAIAECGRFAEAVMAWLARPDPGLLRPI
jgi:hypothetical protein